MLSFDPKGLLQELADGQELFGLVENAAALADRSIVIFGGWEDVNVTIDDSLLPLYRALRAAGARDVTFRTYHTDHGFRNVREALRHSELSPQALLASVFPGLRYVWITRADTVRQAVSWALAAQTNIYSARQLEHRTPEQQPRYDFELIDNLHRLVLEGEAGWRAHFDDCGVEPLRVVYEDLVDDYEGTALRVLDFLGLPPLTPALAGQRTMVRQAAALNDEWARRYVAECS